MFFHMFISSISCLIHVDFRRLRTALGRFVFVGLFLAGLLQDKRALVGLKDQDFEFYEVVLATEISAQISCSFPLSHRCPFSFLALAFRSSRGNVVDVPLGFDLSEPRN